MRKNIKKLFSVLMAMILVLSAAPLSGFSGLDFSGIFAVNVQAADDNTCGENLTWSLSDDGTLTVSGTGAMKNYGYEYFVPWYTQRESIVKIVVEDGVTSLSDFAFYGCNKATSVSLPDTLTSIGIQAFRQCASLTSVDIPDGITTIQDGTFWYCEALTSVTLPDSLKVIGADAFYNCSNLTSTDISDGVTTIGESAFAYCNSLKTITIPKSVSKISNYSYSRSFESCTSLESITVDPENEYFSSDEYGVLYNKDKTELYVYPSCCKAKDYVIPEGVESFGRAFSGATALTSIHIPSTVTSIECAGIVGAFSGCGNLKKVTFAENIQLTEISDYAFNGTAISSINIPESVTSIGEYAFGQTAISSISIPDGVTSIGNSAFWLCRNLTSVKISKNSKLELIGASAFSSLYAEDVAEFEFYIPVGVTSIGKGAFIGSGINKFNVDENNDYYSAENGVLFNKDKTTLIHYNQYNDSAVYTVPSTVTEIEVRAFSNSDNLLTVVLPEGIKKIGEGAFESCIYLSKINFPTSLETIGKAAFRTCWALKGEDGTLVIPDGVTSIGASAFGSTDITQIHIPSSVLAIGDGLLAYWDQSDYTICSDSNTAYAKTYAETYGYTFKLCGGNHTSHTCTYTSKVTKAATCTQTGVETFTCECGNSYTETIPAKGHSYGEWVETVKPTATTSGKKVRTCGACGTTQEQSIAPVPEEHRCSYTLTVTKAATCTQSGVKTFTCECGNSYTQAIPATGHRYGEWTVTVEATIYSSGEQIRHCTGCGNEQTQIINRLTNEDKIIVITHPSTTVINYGDTLILHANINLFALPEGCTIVWRVEGSGVVLTPSEDGLTCKVTSVQNGDITVIATVVDENGEVVTDINGSEIFFAQQLKSKVNFWQRIVSFFKNLFRITRIILQSV